MKLLSVLLVLLSFNAFSQVNETEAAKGGLYEVYLTSASAINKLYTRSAEALASDQVPSRTCLMIGEASANFEILSTLRKVQDITGLDISTDLNNVVLARVSSAVNSAAEHCGSQNATVFSLKPHLKLILEAFEKP